MTTIAAQGLPADAGVVRAPRATAVVAIAVAGCVAAACTVALALTSDHVREPGVHGGLQVWGVLAYRARRASSLGGAGRTAASAR